MFVYQKLFLPAPWNSPRSIYIWSVLCPIFKPASTRGLTNRNGHLVHYITWLSYIYQYKHEPVFYCYRKLLGLTVNIVFRPPPKSSAPLCLRPSLVGPLTIKNSWPTFLTVLRFLFLNYYQHSAVHSAWLQERAMFYNVYTVIIKICRSLIQAETQNNDDQPVVAYM